MTIPSVVMCCIQSEDKKFDGLSLNDTKGQKWLETVKSFRYEPVPGSDSKPYTVRKESTKSGDYWYGYRKMAGKLHKKYIGKTSEISTPLLDSIGEDLNTPPQPRVTDKVTEVTEGGKRVTDRVTDKVTVERFTALELQVQLLQESLEALRSELPGKSDAGNSEELPTVTDTGLQTNVGNLAEYDHALTTKEEALAHAKIYGFTPEEALADAHFQIAMLEANRDEFEDKYEAAKRELAELRSQLETERADRKEVEESFWEMEESFNQAQSENSELAKTCDELRSEIADLKQKSAAGRELPDAADLLNQLKARRKKSKTDLADIEEILEILEGDGND